MLSPMYAAVADWTEWQRTRNALELSHANAPFEPAADRGDFDCFDSAAVRAASTRSCQAEGGAQKVVAIISSDKAKTEAYCQINDLDGQIEEAEQQKDRKKAEALLAKMDELEKQLGPEYLALVDATNDLDPNSEAGQEIESLFEKLDESCPH